MFVWENVAGGEVTDACDHLCTTSQTLTPTCQTVQTCRSCLLRSCVLHKLSNDKVSVLFKKKKKSITQNFEKIKQIS